MPGNRRVMRYIAFLAASLFAGFAMAEQCTAIFPGGIQSHSPSGFIQMGYMSRVYGSGPTLVAPTVTHTHSWQDQVGLCDGVKCAASGTHAATSTPTFLTGSQVPTTFQSGNASGGDLVTGYRAQPLYKSAGDYGRVEVGQASIIGFTSVGGTYLMKGVKTNYQSILEFSSGDYWIDGDLDLQAQDSTLRRIGGGDGTVRLFVRGNVRAGQIKVQGFAAGQIAIYATGNVNFGNGLKLPGFIYANGSVYLGTEAEVTGGVYSNNFSTNSSPIIRYTQINHDHKMGTLTPAYDSTFELAPGNYWIDGDLTAKVATKFRKLPGEGKVRLFVRGNIEIQHAAVFENFGGGDLLMYATGNITISSQKDLPAFVYAAGDVTINFSNNGRYKGGITGRNIYIGQGSIVEHEDPVALGPLCDSGGAVAEIDHFEIVAPASGITCSPVEITVKACLDTTCSNFYVEAVNAEVSVTQGTTTTGYGKSFSGGYGDYALRAVKEGAASLGVTASTPSALNPPLCQIGTSAVGANCTLEMYSSGFLVDVPDFISGDSVQAKISAIKADKNDPQTCGPAFSQAGPRSVKLWSSYIDPDSSREIGHGSVTIAGSAVSKINDSQTTTYSLTFNDAAVANLQSLSYADAGKMALHVSYSGAEGSPEEGLSMIELEGEGQFVATPASFEIKMPSGVCDPEESFTGSNCPAFKAAGDGFDLDIGAVNRSGEPTPNFEHTVRLLVGYEGDDKYYPRDGVPPKIYPENYAHGLGGVNSFGDPNGDPVPRVDEVGVVKLVASAENYLKAGNNIVGVSHWVRFIPASLEVSGVASLESCDGFSYQRELVTYSVVPKLMVTGKNRQGGTTENYDRGDFWRLPSSLSSTWWTLDGMRELTNNLSFPEQDSTLSDAEDPDGQRAYEWSGDGLSYESSNTTPGADDLPFSILQRFSADALTDADGACYMAGTQDCLPYDLPYEASEIRLGRLRIGNAHGSELQQLNLPWTIESWQAPGAFLPEEDDSCSAPTWPNPGLTEPSGKLADIAEQLEVSTIKSGYQGGLTVAAPNVTGSARVGFPDVPEWLWYDWNNDGREASLGLATFGIYKGPQPLIFRREVYR